ncbi:MAG: hypothetical protein KatS3mg015_0229 [Fimbriimonadales bacterium]|nr:MAG: hypothetical protein KatS3mg015_0229 [Fimbriimonadales bacterium]
MIALAVALVVQTHTVTLYRGADLPEDSRYWSCEDTTLSKSAPEASFGQGTLLTLSPDHKVLIRFGDLERAIGPRKRIVSAKLVLTVVQVEQAGTVTLKRFRGPWFEGGGISGEAPADAMNSTWSHQLFHGQKKIRWRNGGAEFTAPSPSAQVPVSQSAQTIEFTGLENDVQQMYDRWYENYGWVIETNGKLSVESSQATSGRPRLIIETEPIGPAAGPDLSVTQISRTPEYPRFDPSGDAYVRISAEGQEAGVMQKPGNAGAKQWPSKGELVTYTATIKNVGDAPSSGFRYTWSKDWSEASKGEVSRTLQPGESVQVEFRAPFDIVPNDHRLNPIRFTLTPSGPDAVEGNNALEIQAGALNLAIWVDESFYKMFAKEPNGMGSRAFEDWIQWQFRIWNDVLFRHSRFSFAPDGIRESTRIQRITIVPDGTLQGGVHVPNNQQDMRYDGDWGFDSSFGEAEKYIDSVRIRMDRALLHEMSHQIGLIDMYQMNVDPSMPDGSGGKVRLKVGDHVLTRGAIDPPNPLMGGGDTRNDLGLPRSLPTYIEDVPDPAYAHALYQRTDLYSATSAFALNANVGYRRGFFGEYLYSVPNVVIVRCLDRNGIPIQTGKLRFYQMKQGVIPDAPPVFEVDIANGTAFLPNRPTGLDQPFTTATGHTLKPNPFGPIDVVGTNGVFLVEIEYEGQREWSWLKAWQLVDAYARGNRQVAFVELRFNVTHRPIKPEDWARNKVVLDSANSSLESLNALVDGDPDTSYQADAEWIEIDIGRDRPIGEIVLLTNGDHDAVWSQFEILVYSTGQRLEQARTFAVEIDWQRTVRFQRDVDPAHPSVWRVAYRALPQTVRFIRLVRKKGTSIRLSGIEIRETEPPR